MFVKNGAGVFVGFGTEVVVFLSEAQVTVQFAEDSRTEWGGSIIRKAAFFFSPFAGECVSLRAGREMSYMESAKHKQIYIK